MKLRKLAALLLCGVMALTACADSHTTVASQPAKVQLGRITIAMPQGERDIFPAAASVLGSKLIEEGGDGTAVQYLTTARPVQLLREGGCDILLVSTQELARSCRELEQLQYPFYFNSGQMADLTLNAQSVLELVSRALEEDGALALASEQISTGYLFSRRGTPREPQDYEGRTLGTTLQRSGEFFQSLDAEVSIQPEEDLREAFLADEIDILELTLEQVPEYYTTQGTLTFSDHWQDSMWVLVRREYYDALESGQQSLLRESVAYLLGHVKERTAEALAAVEEGLTPAVVQNSYLDYTQMQSAMLQYYFYREGAPYTSGNGLMRTIQDLQQ